MVGTQSRDEEAKHPGPAKTRRAKAVLASAMVENGPGSFGAFAESDFAADLMRARWDVDFFCERFLGFTPHPGQTRLFHAYILRDESRWMARYLTLAIAAGNRAGKTLGLAIVILHSCMFKMGKEPPNPLDIRSVERWLKLGYEWYHFGVHSEVAELVFYEITKLLSGNHEAQHGGCPLTETLGEAVADWSKKYRGEYLMIRMHPLLGGATIHFRTTGERAIGSLGKDMDGESFDECAFDPNFDFIVDEVLHMRRLSTGGQLVLIGTMTEGLTAFADKWQEGNPDNPDRKIDSISLRISTRENIGFGIDQRMFDRLVAAMPAYLIPQNIDGFAIESREAFFGSQSVEAVFANDLRCHNPGQGWTSLRAGRGPGPDLRLDVEHRPRHHRRHVMERCVGGSPDWAPDRASRCWARPPRSSRVHGLVQAHRLPYGSGRYGLRRQDVQGPAPDPGQDGRVRWDEAEETAPPERPEEGHRGGQPAPPEAG